ncbi:MAG: hypothetical protein AB1297_05660 [bacterium]
MNREDLEQALVKDGIISQDGLEKAKEEANKESLVRALVYTGLVSEEKMMGFLSLKLGITKINLSKVVGIDSSVVEAVPESLAQAHLIFPIARRKDNLTLAVVDPLDTSTLIMGVAQRLMRTICVKCKEAYEADEKIAKDLGIEERTLLYKGKGCKFCNQIGYKGRTGIYEVMVIDETIQTLIIDQEPAYKIEETARQNGMVTLRESAIKKVLSGITTVEELYRVTT